MDAPLQVASHKSEGKVQDHLSWPAGHVSVYAAKDTIGFLGCECTLLAHGRFFIHQHPQAIFQTAAQNPFIPQNISVLGVILPQVQDFALGPVELPEVLMDPSFRHIWFSTQLCVTCKVDGIVLSPAVCRTDDWSFYPPLRGITLKGFSFWMVKSQSKSLKRCSTGFSHFLRGPDFICCYVNWCNNGCAQDLWTEYP